MVELDEVWVMSTWLMRHPGSGMVLWLGISRMAC